MKKAKHSSVVFCISDSSHLNHSAWHAADISLRDLFIERIAISNKCNFAGFSYLCVWAHTFFTIFTHCTQKCPSSISFLLSSNYQTGLFTRPSAFQSLCLAQITVLLVLDAYLPCLRVCKSYPSWEGCLIKPSLIMHYLCCGHFIPTHVV